MMKTHKELLILFFACFFALLTSTLGCEPFIIESVQNGTTGKDLAQAIQYVDGANDAIFVSGLTEGSMYATAEGQGDLFAVKYEEVGDVSRVKWGWQAGTSGKEFGDGGSCKASNGDFVMVGRTEGDLFGPNNGSNFDVVVATFNPNTGAPVLTVQVGSNGNDYAEDAYCDSVNNLYVAGFTSGSWFAPASGDENTTNDYVLFKMNLDTGVIDWGVQNSSNKFDYFYGVSASADETEIFTVGLTEGSLFGPAMNTADGSTDFLAASFSSSGAFNWGKQWGTTEVDQLVRCHVDSEGFLLASGSSMGSMYATNQGSMDMVVLKMDVSGGSAPQDVEWGVQHGSADVDDAIALGSDSMNDVWVAGYTQGSLFGTVKAGTDGYVAKLDGTDGSILVSNQEDYSTTSNDAIQALVVDLESDNAHITGSSAGSLFGQNIGLGDYITALEGCDDQWSSTRATCGADSNGDDDDDDQLQDALIITAVVLAVVGIVGLLVYYSRTHSSITFSFNFYLLIHNLLIIVTFYVVNKISLKTLPTQL